MRILSYRLVLTRRMTGLAFGVDEGALVAAGRGPAPVALARQAGMYLAHVVDGASYTEAGALVGRDRTTAAHAVRLIEARRERDGELDARLTSLETLLRGSAAE